MHSKLVKLLTVVCAGFESSVMFGVVGSFGTVSTVVPEEDITAAVAINYRCFSTLVLAGCEGVTIVSELLDRLKYLTSRVRLDVSLFSQKSSE
jgi:hypothetical protein